MCRCVRAEGLKKIVNGTTLSQQVRNKGEVLYVHTDVHMCSSFVMQCVWNDDSGINT